MSIRKHGNRYQVRVRVGGGKRIERTLPPGASYKDAQQLRAQIIRAQIDVQVGRPQQYLIDKALDRWIETSAKALKSWQKDVRYRVDVLRDYTAGKYLEQLAEVADAVKKRGIELKKAPATTNRLLSILRRVGNLAIKWKWTREAHGIELVPGELPREAYVTPAQVRKLMAAAEPLTRDFMVFASLTGLRRGEVLRLQKEHLRDGGVMVDNRSKSGKSRWVPLAPEAAAIAKRRVPFQIKADNLRRRVDKARDAAGLRSVQLRDLRHAFGTWLAESGMPAPSIRDLMGHSSLTVTSRYVQTAAKHLALGVNKLPRLGGVRAGTSSQKKVQRKTAKAA